MHIEKWWIKKHDWLNCLKWKTEGHKGEKRFGIWTDYYLGGSRLNLVRNEEKKKSKWIIEVECM